MVGDLISSSNWVNVKSDSVSGEVDLLIGDKLRG